MTENKQDLVAVVRCGDCRYFVPAVFEGIEPVEPPYCNKVDLPFDDPPFYFGNGQRNNDFDDPYDYMDNGFCAWGERKLNKKEIKDIYEQIPEDIKELVEYGIFSKEEVSYMIAHHM